MNHAVLSLERLRKGGFSSRQWPSWSLRADGHKEDKWKGRCNDCVRLKSVFKTEHGDDECKTPQARATSTH